MSITNYDMRDLVIKELQAKLIATRESLADAHAELVNGYDGGSYCRSQTCKDRETILEGKVAGIPLWADWFKGLTTDARSQFDELPEARLYTEMGWKAAMESVGLK